MAVESKIYKCDICGNVIEMLDNKGPVLECCGEAMTEMVENTTDAAKEKHVPVVEMTEEGMKVTVGSVAHPMTPEHWIQWIEVIGENGISRKYLTPDDEPVAVFNCGKKCTTAPKVREYCNLHGLWAVQG